MWFVVHFFNDESVEAVPDTWLKKMYVHGQMIENILKDTLKKELFLTS